MKKIAELLLHSTLGSLHILAAVAWVGSMLYQQFGSGPALRKLGDPKAYALSGIATQKYSVWTWGSFIALVGTGLYAVFDKWEEITRFKSAGTLLAIKLAIVLVFFIIFLIQLYYYGPRMSRLINPATPKAQSVILEMKRVDNRTRALAWWHLATGVAVIVLGVFLAGALDRAETEKKIAEKVQEVIEEREKEEKKASKEKTGPAAVNESFETLGSPRESGR